MAPAVRSAWSLRGVCRHSPRPPELLYDHAIETLFGTGDMVAAASEARKGYKDLHANSPEWAWKFTILRARIRYRRGMNEEVLTYPGF